MKGITVGKRQTIIAELEGGEHARLARARFNKHDHNAIKVYVDRDVIGFIDRESAAYLAPLIDRGEADDDRRYSAVITDVVEWMPNDGDEIILLPEIEVIEYRPRD